ncbi:MAG TPA: M3 family metallopeptidase [Candidatus Paceibacterota bacterium]|nr:M3 family metallopeptidase [Candidatus Paceibacterota bacterium]
MKLKRTRYKKTDFKWVNWEAADFKRIAIDGIRRKKETYAKIRAIPAAERTFVNTIYALEMAGEQAWDEVNRISLLKEVSTKPEIRAAAAKTIEFIQKQLVEIEFDPRMYMVIKEYARKREKLHDSEKLLFRDLKKGYERMGFDLPKLKREKIKANIKLLGKLSLAFDHNLNEYKDYLLVTEAELDGLPDSYRANLEKVGNKFKITMSYPDVHPFMAGAHNENKRRELLEKFVRRGGPQNIVILKKMFRLRAENAQLLGYKTHADFQTELRMAKSAVNVWRFVKDLERRTKKQAAHDLAMLKTDKKCRTGDTSALLGAHDISYLFKQIRKEKFNIDSDVVKEYFPFEHVKRATLDAYQKLLGVTFKRRTDVVLWHSDVQMYDVYDTRDGYLSTFILDLYPREGKYGHACASELTYGRQEGEMYRAPLAAMLANFPKPSPANPSLMSHREVETFFHEFGHVMHFTLTKARYSAQSGFNVAMDFVEAPSQMLENWVWDAGMLTRLSKHYKTSRPMPRDLIARIIGARLFGEAWSVRSQLVLASLDLIIHTKEVKDPVKLYAELDRKLMGIMPPKRQLWLAGFGHIAHGYDAGYYGYLWSRVYAEDMFSRFANEGVLNSKTGHEYRRWILEKGSSMEEMDLVRRFLGRKPSNKAFLKSIGA